MQGRWISSCFFFVLINVCREYYYAYEQRNVFQEFSWKKPYDYYYRKIEEKLRMILLGECLQNYELLPMNANISVPTSKKKLHVISYSVDESLFQWWRSIPKPVQMRVDPRLCSAVYKKKKPIFKNRGCQLPDYMSPSAPRCQTKYLKYICDASSLNMTDSHPNHFFLPESDHKTWLTPPLPWLIIAREATVSLCGHISSNCGIVHTTANCKAYAYKMHSGQFRKACPLQKVRERLQLAMERNESKDSLSFTCDRKAPWSDQLNFYGKVFVIAEVDDTYIYHIHLEILPRIIFHLKFLQENPDVRILYGCDTAKQKAVTEAGLQQGLIQLTSMLKLFNLTDTNRFIVHQHVYAREIYLPMEGGCQDPVYNTWMILHMRRQVFRLLHLHDRTKEDFQGKKRRRVLSLLKRSANSWHTRNKHDLVRQWSDEFATQILQALQSSFPSIEVRLISDRNETLMNCFECQVRAFAETDVLIGIHGAGLGMSLYMPPNSAVVEIAPYPNDGRCLLGGGPFSRLAAVLSHNYMMHHPPYEEFLWMKGRTSEFNVTSLVIHVKSFLQSIQFLDP